jgi:hypothetical protein
MKMRSYRAFRLFRRGRLVVFPGCAIKPYRAHPDSYRPDLPLRSQLPQEGSLRVYPRYKVRCSAPHFGLTAMTTTGTEFPVQGTESIESASEALTLAGEFLDHNPHIKVVQVTTEN